MITSFDVCWSSDETLNTALGETPNGGDIVGIRVLICDEHTAVHVGIVTMLGSEADIEVIGELSDLARAPTVVRDLQPDVLIIGSFPNQADLVKFLSGIIRLDDRSPKVVLLASTGDRRVIDSLRSGVRAVVAAGSPAADLINAIRAVANGHAMLTPEITGQLLDWAVQIGPIVGAPPASVASLSEREREVLAQLAQGLSNAEIAAELSISESTVRSHIHHVLTKLSLRDRVQAVVLAHRHGLAAPLVGTVAC